MLSLDEIERALVITAHPDDVDFGAAGTIANLTDLGATVTYCIVTDGQAGGFDDSIPRPKMASTRREEQTEAASKVGVSDLLFLGWMDGEVESGSNFDTTFHSHSQISASGSAYSVSGTQPSQDL